MKDERLNVVIIGAGKIGASRDEPESVSIQSHAHGVMTNPDFKLCGFIDRDIKIAKRQASRWHTKYYESIQVCQKEINIDVVIIAVPDKHHYICFEQLVQQTIPLIILEKPVALTQEDGRHMQVLAEKMNQKVLVNYSRRFNPIYTQLAKRMRQGEWGAFIGGSGYYGKGICHNGTHMLDLLNYLLGSFKQHILIKRIKTEGLEDQDVSAVLRYATGDFSLETIKEKHYTIFDMDLLFEQGRIQVSDLGRRITVYGTEISTHFKGHTLLKAQETYDTESNIYMTKLYQHAAEILRKGVKPICSLEDGVLALNQGLVLKNG